eukprot:SAG11_NODE_12046_length_724_cov_1.486400_1_plen_166_part_10
MTGQRDATAEEMGADMAALRVAIQAAVKTYVGETYAETVHAATYSKGGKIFICISGAEFDAGNMVRCRDFLTFDHSPNDCATALAERALRVWQWSGRWRSAWEISVDGDAVTLKGAFKVHVHFYEEGNVQAKSEHTVEETVAGGDTAETAAAVVDKVKTLESQYHA